MWRLFCVLKVVILVCGFYWIGNYKGAFIMNIDKILVASTNKNKICQIESKLSPIGIKILNMSDFDIQEPPEIGKDYKENAMIKAENAFLKTGIPSLADDSGFELEYLNNFPGIVSARFSEACGGYEKAFEILDKGLSENKKACFRTALAFVYTIDGKVLKKIFEGKLDGEFVFPPRGEHGFGYCPCFKPIGYEKTIAEIPDNLRKKINHRAIALNKFYEFLER